MSISFYVKSIWENLAVLKLPFFVIFGALDIDNFLYFSLPIAQKNDENQNSELLNVFRMTNFGTLGSPNLISQKT